MKRGYRNAFDAFNMDITFNISIEDLQKKYVKMLTYVTNNDDRVVASGYYNSLLNPITRGEVVLSIFNIRYSDINIDDTFLIEISELHERGDVNEACKIQKTHANQLNQLNIIDKANCKTFAHHFLRYKYISTLMQQIQ